MKILPKFTGFDHCSTPAEVYSKLDAEFDFDFDPCPLHGEEKFDGLADSTQWGTRNFINPPYSNVTPWIVRARIERLKGNLSVLLLKGDTSTKNFHLLILPLVLDGRAELRFVKGRITFPPRTKPAPFPSLIVVFRP